MARIDWEKDKLGPCVPMNEGVRKYTWEGRSYA
jgi:hypothetical protein